MPLFKASGLTGEVPPGDLLHPAPSNASESKARATHQCGVTNAGRGGALIPADVVPGKAARKEVLTWPSLTLRAGNASRPEPASPAR